eukprot:1136418-Pelagomonas_calceolata.AAC.2
MRKRISAGACVSATLLLACLAYGVDNSSNIIPATQLPCVYAHLLLSGTLSLLGVGLDWLLTTGEVFALFESRHCIEGRMVADSAQLRLAPGPRCAEKEVFPGRGRSVDRCSKGWCVQWFQVHNRNVDRQ